MSACRNGKTPGRMKARACGHKGFGAVCHRCGQAQDLENKANELASAIKAKALPSFVWVKEASPNQEPGILIKAGAQRVFVGTASRSQEAALTQAVTIMRGHAARLLARPKDTKTVL